MKWLALLLVLISGCAHSLLVYAPVTLPARVPVQVFPSVWVAGPASQDEGYLLDNIAAQLARDAQREVRRLDAEQLKAARAAGQVPGLTVVLRLSLSLASGTQNYTDMVPIQYCGMFGCSMQYQPYVGVVAQITGSATLSVEEGPTGRELQRERFVVTFAGDDEQLIQEQLFEQLATQLSRAVDIGQTKEPYLLYRSKDPLVERGVELLGQGKWAEGRAQLERAAKQLGGLDKQTQARVWYDLGIARMIAPGKAGLTDRAFADARRALDWADRLAPSELHRRALKRLVESRKRSEILAEQARARQHNFALVRGD